MTLKINPNQLNNPATSDWLRAALQDALRRDLKTNEKPIYDPQN